MTVAVHQKSSFEDLHWCVAFRKLRFATRPLGASKPQLFSLLPGAWSDPKFRCFDPSSLTLCASWV